MSSQWKDLPKHLPIDGATVWVRRINLYSQPYQATWDLTTATFTDTTSGLISPWYAIAQWRLI